MSTILNKISQISIYLKGSEGLEHEAEKVNEVVLFQPISKRASFDENSARLKARKWTFLSRLPLHRRLFLKIKTFFFHHLHLFISKERLSGEAKFKTVLAILLSQEELRDFFLGSRKSKESFFAALKNGAAAAHYHNFQLPNIDDKPLVIANGLTTLSGKKLSLIDDPIELNCQMATLSQGDKDAILYAILNQIERDPITSVLEVVADEGRPSHIEMTTCYAKCLIHSLDSTGKIAFTIEHNRSTSSLEPPEKREKGVVNQRIVYENGKHGAKNLIGSYSGELLTRNAVLEQLLFLINARNDESYYLLKTIPKESKSQEVLILFTSLFSWNEYDKILKEHEAIDQLHNHYLKVVSNTGETRFLHLKLHHQNLSFNALNKFPVPSETKAHMRDLNDETLIVLTACALDFLKIENPLSGLVLKMDEGRSSTEYLQKQKVVHDAIDHFHMHIKPIIKVLESALKKPLEQLHFEVATCIKALLLNKTVSERKLHGIDALIYTINLTTHLKFMHHTNCSHSNDKSGAANAIEKAQNAFRAIQGYSFLPGVQEQNELLLFQVLYSMYLVWEEPELNAGLNTGYVGEKFFRNFIQKNPETTRYLTPWLKHHPQMYLALSDYRL
jgi:hypothetical protein